MEVLCWLWEGKQCHKWTGTLEILKASEDVVEVIIEARGTRMDTIIARRSDGQYCICVPDLSVGSHLARLDDYAWNLEALSSSMNEVDAATIASALTSLPDILNANTHNS